ncbi:hypothetical protein [Corallibacter sp.]|uniref:hypothetical protein n=1 Tax=Corallibacter sp. TaxID=2038084 RepID=UPI003AB1C3FC
MNKIQLLLFSIFFFSYVSYSQTYSSIVKPRISFIDESRTLNPDLDYLNASNYEYENMIKYYQRIVFCTIYDDTLYNYKLMQWSTDIVIYLDKNLPKSVANGFYDFISKSNINSVNNLNISFTKKVSEANYIIKMTPKMVNGYDKDFEFDSEEERKNSFLTGGTYELSTDQNNKFYSAVLEMSSKLKKTDDQFLKQLKQLFFKSLGNFVADNYKDTDSLLHKAYINSDTISEFDMNILKIHYGIIYEQIINGSKFRSLVKLANSNK